MRVLIIDDYPAVRVRMRQQILLEWPCADVLEAPTLARGVALIQRRKPQLIVLDLALPDASGLVGAWRAMKQMGSLPVLALCHEADRAQAAQLLQMGVSGYLTKALLAGEFMPAVRRVLAGGRFVTARLAAEFLSWPDFPAFDDRISRQGP